RLPIVLLVMSLLLSAFSVAGQRTVSGKVTDDSNGEPLIGVNILIVGTTSGAVTDFDGTYSIVVPEGRNELLFSYTSYASQRITLDASNVVDVKLSPGEILDEVVVIGYGTVKKSDLT